MLQNNRAKRKCVNADNIDELIDLLDVSQVNKKEHDCYPQVLALLSYLYRVEVSMDHVTIPEPMEVMVKEKWLGGDRNLIEQFVNPKLLIVTDRYIHTTATVNPLRAKRPKPGGSGRAFVDEEIEKSRAGCNFCTKKLTLQDVFGRVEWEKAGIFTAENSFRFYDFNGLVIPEKIHNYMDIDYETFHAMVAYNAVLWYGNVHRLHPDRTHPVMVWDVLGKAGASQVHPHMQVFMGRGYYPGRMGSLEAARNTYKSDLGRDYLQDIIDLHISLGLGVRYKTAVAIVPINPTKDNEIWVIGEPGSISDFTRLWFIAQKTYLEELEVYCYSQGIALPTSSFTSDVTGGDLMIAKLGARGDCASSYNDVSSLELYTISSISTDYYQTIHALSRTLEKYDFSKKNMEM